LRVPENGHEQLEHTADAGIRAFGGSLEEMFENAAEGMFRLLADTGALGEGIEVGLEVTAPSLPELLVEWLEELLYLSERRGLVWKKAKVVSLEEGLEEGWSLRGTAWGAPLESSREALRGEIKGVTYHQLEVEKERGGRWGCRVIYDV